MALTPGTRLGPYEITAQIGVGGMGEVYRATHTTLRRQVAIKVLPESLAGDPDRITRFRREAQTLAALNHPHICTLHDIGTQDGIDFLVMEYLDGATLAQRLEKGALPLDQALTIAIAIADALDKAHRQGIVHRDLKPGNIMLTKAGAKLLDFGLAKLRKPGTVGATDFSAATTQSQPLTERGTILGTLQYMAPEQLEGKEADARTDIFAFGATVYEMVTGQRAFTGESQASLIGAILRDQPVAILSLQPITPRALDRLVTTCMAKEPGERWQPAGDLRRELAWVRDQPTETSSHELVSSHASRWWFAGGALVAALAVATLLVRSNPAEEATSPSVRFAVTLPPTDRLVTNAGRPVAVAVSPDGRRAVYAARRNGIDGLYSRTLDELESDPVPNAEGATGPFFSPDGEWLGFFADGLLQKLPLAGGPPIAITPVQNFLNASWSRSGSIFFHTWGSALMSVSEDGGTPEPLTHLDEDR